MSDGRVHISGIELHMMPGCQEEIGQGLHEGCKCGHGEGTERRDTKKVKLCLVPYGHPSLSMQRAGHCWARWLVLAV